MTYADKLETVAREFGPTPERREALRRAVEDLVVERLVPEPDGTLDYHGGDHCREDEEAYFRAVAALEKPLLAALRLHERGSVEPCWTERANIIAWLMHVLRLRPLTKLVERRLEEFEREHEAERGKKV